MGRLHGHVGTHVGCTLCGAATAELDENSFNIVTFERSIDSLFSALLALKKKPLIRYNTVLLYSSRPTLHTTLYYALHTTHYHTHMCRR